MMVHVFHDYNLAFTLIFVVLELWRIFRQTNTKKLLILKKLVNSFLVSAVFSISIKVFFLYTYGTNCYITQQLTIGRSVLFYSDVKISK